MNRHAYRCTECGRVIASIARWHLGGDGAWHDKGHDTVRQRVLVPGTVDAGATACGPLVALVPAEDDQ